MITKEEAEQILEAGGYDSDSIDWDVYRDILADPEKYGLTVNEKDAANGRGVERAEAENAARSMTREEALSKARMLFGPKAQVYYSDHEWVIRTNSREKFDPEQYKDRPAYELYSKNSYGENQLERWAYKNGHSGESMAELFDSYEENNLAEARKAWEMVKKAEEEGMPLSWEGDQEYRNRVLEYGKEQGWE